MLRTFEVAAPRPLLKIGFGARWFTGAEGDLVQSTFSRRAFVAALGMLSVPLIGLTQDREKNEENREEKKKEAEEKKEEAKDKAEDAVDDRNKVVDAPGTDNSQDRRQDRRRDAVK
jgi:hypothetical protein